MTLIDFRSLFLATLAAILAILAACGPSESPTAEFMVTPEAEGSPQFLRTPEEQGSLDEEMPEAAYPGPQDESYPAPQEAVEDAGYPAPQQSSSVDGRSRTALNAYPLAEEVALAEFSPDAYLSSILPSHLAIRNLSNPPVLPGWFYEFRRPNSRREFIVQVVDETVTGTTLTEAIRDPARAEQPIDLGEVQLDSPDVFVRFEGFAEDNELLGPDDILYDLELVNLEGTDGPVWTVVDISTFERIFALDAVSGEQVANPYE